MCHVLSGIQIRRGLGELVCDMLWECVMELVQGVVYRNSVALMVICASVL